MYKDIGFSASICLVVLLATSACLLTPAAPPAPAPATGVATSAAATSASAASSAPASTGGSSPQAARPGTYNETIPSGGQKREYIIHIPTGYNSAHAVPLVFMLHGVGGTDHELASGSGMVQKADQAGFVVVFPNGTGNPSGWNNGIFPQPLTTLDDVAFVRDMISRFEGRLHIDPKRIYVAGFSNGAFMTYRLGAELSGQLAAIAVAEGTIGTHQGGASLTIPQAGGPLPVLIFHGEKDTTVPYNGGLSAGMLHLTVFSVADALAFWNRADGCTRPPVKQTLNNGNVTTEDFQGCTAGSEVLLYTIKSGEHEWPTLQDHAKLDGAAAVWDFFSKHPHP